MERKQINLKINGKQVTGYEGETILQVAKRYGIDIPTFCHLDGLKPLGACRFCIVEVKGAPRPVPACSTVIADGMEIETETERIKRYRKLILELLMAERFHICSVCLANGNCELQDYASRYGLTHVRFPRTWTGYQIDASHERFVLDHNRCVLCMRCIRVCDEVEGAHVLDLKGRGFGMTVTIDADSNWGDSSSCTSCGKCTYVCPTGAIWVKGKPVGETRRKDIPSFLNDRRRWGWLS